MSLERALLAIQKASVPITHDCLMHHEAVDVTPVCCRDLSFSLYAGKDRVYLAQKDGVLNKPNGYFHLLYSRRRDV